MLLGDVIEDAAQPIIGPPGETEERLRSGDAVDIAAVLLPANTISGQSADAFADVSDAFQEAGADEVSATDVAVGVTTETVEIGTAGAVDWSAEAAETAGSAAGQVIGGLGSGLAGSAVRNPWILGGLALVAVYVLGTLFDIELGS